MRVLIVKMSSLGDVVHTLPAVTDAAAARHGELTLDWVVEEAFAPIAARHPAVHRVLPIAWRRWRRDLAGHRGDWRAFVSALRGSDYDLVLDAQGLVKSAAVTVLARGGSRVGLSWGSAREPLASLVLGRPVAVAKGGHAIDRLRQLFAEALGYAMPSHAPDFGLPRPARPNGRCLLLHGTTWPSKLWPTPFWRDLAQRAAAAGFEVVVPWGSDEERVRAGEITAGTPARVLDRLGLDALADELAAASLVVGADSGLAHLAAALGVPTVVLFGATSLALTGCRGRRVANLQSTFACSPCLSRHCRYRGPLPAWQGQPVTPACFGELPPERVWTSAQELLDADRVLHL
ncbi:MAG: lipopolysaccharide heptosyltransferase I [Pseudomonadales bacterium]